MVLPWYNPLRFAEDVAMLQTMSRKTLHIGMGRGTAKLEYDAFELDMAEARDRFRESWEVIRTALIGEPFTYKGKYLSVDKEIRLRPRLDDRKPNFYGAISSPESAEIMAGLDLPPLSLAQSPNYVLEKVIQRWRATRRQMGASETGTFPILVQCYVGDTDEQARKEAKRYLPIYFQRQVEHYEVLKDHWKNIKGYEQFSRFFSNLVALSDPNNIGQFIDMNAIGSAETVIRRIKELSAIGFNHFLMSTATPGVPKEIRHGNMKRFAYEVMPHFRVDACAA
jgi:alkanesulfonate monooxygenase SsuD/methylene tetrahydromethanopterin reductase-like flavin-dependent oxidoreductase (luciferase family)